MSKDAGRFLLTLQVPGSLLSSDESESFLSLRFTTEIVQCSSHRKCWRGEETFHFFFPRNWDCLKNKWKMANYYVCYLFILYRKLPPPLFPVWKYLLHPHPPTPHYLTSAQGVESLRSLRCLLVLKKKQSHTNPSHIKSNTFKYTYCSE